MRLWLAILLGFAIPARGAENFASVAVETNNFTVVFPTNFWPANRAAISNEVIATLPGTTEGFVFQILSGQRVFSAPPGGGGASSNILVFTNVAEMVSFNAAGVSESAVADVQGYYVRGDGGGGRFIKTSWPWSGPGTNGVYFQAVGGGFWERIDKGPVMAEWFGVFGTNSVPTNNVSARIQGAVDFAEMPGRHKKVIIAGTGNYMTRETVMVKSAKIEGTYQRQTITDPGYGTTIYQDQGATGPVFKIVVDSTALQVSSPAIRNLQIYGSKARNQLNPREITAVNSTNRLVFFVAPDDLPSDPPDTNSFPYYGFVFFYTPDPFYAGHAVVQSVNRTTGQVDLYANYGTPYATPAATPGVLSTSWTAVFSPIVTQAARLLGTMTDVSPGSAGYAGIEIAGYDEDALQHTVIIEDVTINNCHVGILNGLTIFPYFKNIFCQGYAFAGMAATFDQGGRDQLFDGFCYMSGFASTDLYVVAPTNLTETLYTRGAWGTWLMECAGFSSQLTADGPVNGFAVGRAANSLIDRLRGDGVLSRFVLFLGSSTGGYGEQRTEIDFGIVSGLSPNVYQNLNGEQTRVPRYFIESDPRPGLVTRASIDRLDLNQFGNINGYLDAIFCLRGSNDFVHVNSIVSSQGFTNVFVPGTTKPHIGPHTGITTAELAGNGPWKGEGTNEYNIAVNGLNRLKMSAGSSGFDLINSIYKFGADTANGNLRTANANKQMWIEGANYLAGNAINDTNFVPLIGLSSQATVDAGTLGYTGGGIRPNPTDWFIGVTEGGVRGGAERISARLRQPGWQINANADATIAHISTVLELIATNKLFRPPTMTSNQMAAIVAGGVAQGAFGFDTDRENWYGWDGSALVPFATPAAGGGSDTNWNGNPIASGTVTNLAVPGQLVIGTNQLPAALTNYIRAVLDGKPLVNLANGDLWLELIGNSSALAFAPFAPSALNGGSSSIALSDGEHESCWDIAAGSAQANSGVVYPGRVDHEYINGGELHLVIFRIGATNQTVLLSGLSDSVTVSEATDGVLLRVDDGWVSGRCHNNSTFSDTLTSNLIAQSTWYMGGWYAETNRVDFILVSENGATVWTDAVTNNIPITVARSTGMQLKGYRSNSTNTPSNRLTLDAAGWINTKPKLR